MYPSGYTQDTSRYIRIRILITNPPKLDNKPPRSRGSGEPAGPQVSQPSKASREPCRNKAILSQKLVSQL